MYTEVTLVRGEDADPRTLGEILKDKADEGCSVFVMVSLKQVYISESLRFIEICTVICCIISVRVKTVRNSDLKLLEQQLRYVLQYSCVHVSYSAPTNNDQVTFHPSRVVELQIAFHCNKHGIVIPFKCARRGARGMFIA